MRQTNGKPAHWRLFYAPKLEPLEDRTLLTTSALPQLPGLSADWTADDNANDVVGANNGVLVNGATFAPGISGQAFAFNSGFNQYVQVPHSDQWAFGQSDFSLDLWVNLNSFTPTSIGNPAGIAFIASDEGSGNLTKWFFGLDGGLNFHINSPTTGPVFIGNIPFSPALHTWYNLAVTRSADLFTFYVNGQPLGTATSSLTVPNANAALTIGSAEGAFFLDGLEDEIQIYNRALLPGEVTDVYSAGAQRGFVLVGAQHIDQVRRYDAGTGNLIDVFASGSTLSQPIGLTYGPDGNLYVSSFGSNSVLRFDGTTGAFKDIFVPGLGDGGGLRGPLGITFGPDENLYVGSAFTNQILRFDGHSGAFMDVFAVTPSITNNGLAFGPDGNLWVSGQGTHAVLRFSGTTGAFVDTFVQIAGDPHGLAFAPDGSLWVGRVGGTGSIEHFDSTGKLLGEVPGGPYVAIGPDADLYAQYGGGIARFNSETGDFIDQFIVDPVLSSIQPTGIAFQSVPSTTNHPPPARLVQFANTITRSREHYAQFVTNAYQTYLGRASDTGGLNGWVAAMQNGLTDEQLEAKFLASAEYIAAHGGPDAGWVKGMYQDLLNRTPSDAEVQSWVNGLNHGLAPQTVAFGFAGSREREWNRVRGDYPTFLGRTPSEAEVDSSVNSFAKGLSNEGLVAGFVGSGEYDDGPVKGKGNNLDWIKAATQDELQRPATTAEINAALAALTPANLTAAANLITHGVDHYFQFVTSAYQAYLGRAPDPSGLDNWVKAMQSGLTDEQLEAGFIGAPEYIANHGGQGAGWVKGMYQDILQRTPSQAEIDGWVQALNAGVKPQDVAYGFAASAEREGLRVRGDYQTFLGRTPAQAEVDGWVNAFLHGLTNESLAAGFLGSIEYFNAAAKGRSDKADWVHSAVLDELQRTPTLNEFDSLEGMLQ